MAEVTNTERDERMPWALRGGDPAAIEAQERKGQSELVQSDLLPTLLLDPQDAFEALGFVFLGPVEGDPVFQQVRFPEGWTRKAAPDHDMWSYIYDETGTKRVSVFYKAAFYDRNAHARIETDQS